MPSGASGRTSVPANCTPPTVPACSPLTSMTAIPGRTRASTASAPVSLSLSPFIDPAPFVDCPVRQITAIPGGGPGPGTIRVRSSDPVWHRGPHDVQRVVRPAPDGGRLIQRARRPPLGRPSLFLRPCSDGWLTPEEKTVNPLSPAALAADLAVRDLTDPASGPHALQLLVSAILDAASARWPSASLVVHRGSRVVSVADNYDHLGYPPSAKARDSRYTRYVDQHRLLRSQTSALIPGALRGLTSTDALIAAPGMVYRRDAIDRLHTGTPHQLDLWRLGAGDLLELVGIALRAALPG